jgi:hypothetical protein
VEADQPLHRAGRAVLAHLEQRGIDPAQVHLHGRDVNDPQTPYFAGEVSVEDVGEASFERASGFGWCFAFAEFALVVDAAGAWVAGLDERDGV